MRALMFAVAIAGIAVAVPAAAQDANRISASSIGRGMSSRKSNVAPSKSDSWEEDILGTGLWRKARPSISTSARRCRPASGI